MARASVSKNSSSGIEAIVNVKQRKERVELTELAICWIAGRRLKEVAAKECTKCRNVKALDEYSIKANGLGKRKSMCKRCVNESYFNKRIESDIEYKPGVSKVFFVGSEENKECLGCREIKPKDDFFYQKTGRISRNSKCKVCCYLHAKKKYEEQKPVVQEKQRAAYAKNKEIIRSQKRDYFIRNRDRILLRSRMYYKNVKLIPEFKERRRNYVNRNFEKEARRKAEWRELNRDKVRASRHKRKTIARNLLYNWTLSDVELISSDFSGSCALTGGNSTHDDHFIALATGHCGTYHGNMILLAGAVNESKWALNPFEWIRMRPDIDANRFDAVVAYLSHLNGLTLDEYRQFVDWCYANPRTIDEIKHDNERYGYVVSSLELWREATGIAFPIRIDFRNNDVKEVSA